MLLVLTGREVVVVTREGTNSQEMWSVVQPAVPLKEEFGDKYLSLVFLHSLPFVQHFPLSVSHWEPVGKGVEIAKRSTSWQHHVGRMETRSASITEEHSTEVLPSAVPSIQNTPLLS